MNRDVVVLVAESEKDRFELTKRSLNQWGVSDNVLQFDEGGKLLDFLEAVEILKSLAVKQYIVLLDINVKGTNGVEVLKRIKRNPRYDDILVVMLTGINDPIAVSKCYLLGCDGYFVKPLKLAEFLKFLANFRIIIRKKTETDESSSEIEFYKDMQE